ncbi:MAG: hypothetical protein FWB87_05405 [Defluviitaleaceae bacterium]|nr:hypothetical protein [Defluviitaleaceae bacterium]
MSINSKFSENESNEEKRHKENTEMKRSLCLAAKRCSHCGTKDVETIDHLPISIESVEKIRVPYDYSHMRCRAKKCGRTYSFKFR